MSQSQNFSIQNGLAKPSLRTLLDGELDKLASRMNCSSIGTIKAYNASNQTVNVQINYKKVLQGGNVVSLNKATDLYLDYPLLLSVPAVFLQGGGAYLSFPIAVGDTCLVMFCDREIDTFLQYGYTTPQPPQSPRVHDINDAIALIGVRSFTNSLKNIRTDICSLTDNTGERLAQAGFLQAYAGSSAPSGWLLCYGQAVSRGTYATLFSVIGTTYGSGDGSTTFNLPDLRGRTIAGLDNMGGTDANVLTATFTPNRNTLGGTAGEEAHQLVISEMPSHSHSAKIYRDSGATNQVFSNSYTTNYDGQISTNNEGGDGQHNNVQPTLMINWIIKI